MLFRDNHTCQLCKNKNVVLKTHHIIFKSKGGTDKPNNQITLCMKCHTPENHKEGAILYKWMVEGKKTGNFKDAAFMGIMRWAFYNRLKELYDNVNLTYGYMTKNTRILNNLSKGHRIDALCISENSNIKQSDNWYYIKKVRNQNRQLHKNTILKGGYRKANKASKYVFGYQIFDKIKYQKQECFIFGRRSSGSFDIRKLDGTKVSAGVSYKKLKLTGLAKSLLWERRKVS